MKHRNGTEYVLCPKVATEEMVFAPNIDVGHKTAGKTWSGMIEISPPYEPADEVVEKCAQAMLVEQFGQGAMLLFNPPREMTDEEKQVSRDRIDLARRQVRTVLSAFIGREG